MRPPAGLSAPGKPAPDTSSPILAPSPTPPAPNVQVEQSIEPGAESLEQIAAGLEELDLDALFEQMVDENLAAIAFDPDDLSTLAAQLGADDPNHVGYSDAQDLGILED